MNDLILIDLPKHHGEIKGCWYNGYPIHQGHTEESLNFATVYANQNKIIPDQKILKKEFQDFLETLKKAGFHLHLLPFPEELNHMNCLHHDAIFLRDAGLFFKDLWIKARFSAKDRHPEAEVHARVIAKRFRKQIVELPEGAFLEFGEVFFLRTKKGSYYFGGLSRSNKKSHDAVREIVQPEYFTLIASEGYHLDTIFSPVLNKENELIAFLLVKKMIAEKSLKALEEFEIPLINLDPKDSSGEGEELGNYAVNSLIAPGMLLNSCAFETAGVEEKLKSLGIQRFISPLTSFRFAGGSYHCLTNEMYT